MHTDPLLARLSREFLALHRVYRYHLKAVKDMDDAQVVRTCHFYCEENRLTEEWEAFRRRAEAAADSPQSSSS